MTAQQTSSTRTTTSTTGTPAPVTSQGVARQPRRAWPALVLTVAILGAGAAGILVVDQLTRPSVPSIGSGIGNPNQREDRLAPAPGSGIGNPNEREGRLAPTSVTGSGIGNPNQREGR